MLWLSYYEMFQYPNSMFYSLIYQNGVSGFKYNSVVRKGKEKVVLDGPENASNDTEGFVTPCKRTSSSDSDDEDVNTGTQKSSSRIKAIKMEK